MSRFNNGKGYVSRKKVEWAHSPLRKATLDLSGGGSYVEEGLTCAGCGNVLTAPERCEFCGNHSEV